MAEISPTELSDRLRDGDDESEDVLVLDIRHRDEYDEWHVPDSVNIDIYDELTDDPETAKDALEDLRPTARSSLSVPQGSFHRPQRRSCARWATTPARSPTA